MARPQRISDEVLLEALTTAGEVTAGELASLVGIGQSTAAKRLAALETNGATRRGRGDRVNGVLVPDRWSAADPPQRRPVAPAGRASQEDPSETPNAESSRAEGSRLRRRARCPGPRLPCGATR